MKKDVRFTEKSSKITYLVEGDKFSFGKYKGRAVIEVLVSDPQYIIWVNNNVKHVKFNDTIISRANSKAKQKENDFYRRRQNIDYDEEPLISNILDL